jgi:hypothetical protein
MRRSLVKLLSVGVVACAATLVPAAPSSAGGLLGGLVKAVVPPRNEVALDLLSDSSAPLVGDVLRTLGWGIQRRTGGPRALYVASPSGLLAAAQSTVLSTLSVLPGVRRAEENVLFLVDRKYGGEQAQMPVLHDDMAMACVSTQPAMQTVRAPQGAPAFAGGAGPIVAIVDGGFDLRHEMMRAANLVPGADVRDGGSDPSDLGDGRDGDGDGVVDGGLGHGDAVAAIVSVVAPSARILPIRALDDEGNGTVADLAAGIWFALDRGASVINFSLGTERSSAILDDAISAAYARGVTVVAAAGNAAETPVLYPASSPYTVAVVGTDARGMKDSYSNWGSAAELGAPSVDIVAPFPGTLDKYGTWHGTSFATPFFAAAIARTMQMRSVPATTAWRMLVGSTQPYPYVDPAWRGGLGTGILDLSR